MVYTQLHIVVGSVLTYADLERIFDIEDPYAINDIDLDAPMEIFPFSCCSDSATKLFIIGYKLHTYYRNHIRCDDCGEHTVCNKCIGHTNNGYYDVKTILNEPTEVNIRNVCVECWADNKRDMGARLETAPIVNHRFQSVDVDVDVADANHEELNCIVCNIKPYGFRSPMDNLMFHEWRYNSVAKFIAKNNLKTDIKLYYMINDCLSCT